MTKKHHLSLAVAVVCVLQAICAWAIPLTFTVAPDHTNHLYRIGEEAAFTVTATTNGVPVREGRVTAALDNFGPKTQGEKAFDLAKGNPFVVRGRLDEPGFLRLTLKAADTKPLVWSVGYEPERIEKGSPLVETTRPRPSYSVVTVLPCASVRATSRPKRSYAAVAVADPSAP